MSERALKSEISVTTAMARARGCERRVVSDQESARAVFGQGVAGRVLSLSDRPGHHGTSHVAHASAATDAAKIMTNEWLAAVYTSNIKSTGTKNKRFRLYNSPKALLPPRVGSRNATRCGPTRVSRTGHETSPETGRRYAREWGQAAAPTGVARW